MENTNTKQPQNVMPALKNFHLTMQHQLDRDAMKACVDAVEELVMLGRKLKMDRAGVADAEAMFVAPVIRKEDAMAFAAALEKFGGAE